MDNWPADVLRRSDAETSGPGRGRPGQRHRQLAVGHLFHNARARALRRRVGRHSCCRNARHEAIYVFRIHAQKSGAAAVSGQLALGDPAAQCAGAHSGALCRLNERLESTSLGDRRGLDLLCAHVPISEALTGKVSHTEGHTRSLKTGSSVLSKPTVSIRSVRRPRAGFYCSACWGGGWTGARRSVGVQRAQAVEGVGEVVGHQDQSLGAFSTWKREWRT